MEGEMGNRLQQTTSILPAKIILEDKNYNDTLSNIICLSR